MFGNPSSSSRIGTIRPIPSAPFRSNSTTVRSLHKSAIKLGAKRVEHPMKLQLEELERGIADATTRLLEQYGVNVAMRARAEKGMHAFTIDS